MEIKYFLCLVLSLLARKTPDKENNKIIDDRAAVDGRATDAEKGSNLISSSESSERDTSNDLKTSRPLFPFFIPPFRGMYNHNSLQTSGQFDLLRNSNLAPTYSGPSQDNNSLLPTKISCLVMLFRSGSSGAILSPSSVFLAWVSRASFTAATSELYWSL